MPELSVFISVNGLRCDSVYLLTQGNQELINQNILLFHPLFWPLNGMKEE